MIGTPSRQGWYHFSVSHSEECSNNVTPLAFSRKDSCAWRTARLCLCTNERVVLRASFSWYTYKYKNCAEWKKAVYWIKRTKQQRTAAYSGFGYTCLRRKESYCWVIHSPIPYNKPLLYLQKAYNNKHTMSKNVNRALWGLVSSPGSAGKQCPMPHMQHACLNLKLQKISNCFKLLLHY